MIVVVVTATALLLAAASSRHLARVGREAGLVMPLAADRGVRRRHLVALPTPPAEQPHRRAA